jgi:hypothetical protein
MTTTSFTVEELQKLAEEFIDEYRKYIRSPEFSVNLYDIRFFAYLQKLEARGLVLRNRMDWTSTPHDIYLLCKLDCFDNGPAILLKFGVEFINLDFARFVKNEIEKNRTGVKIRIYK